jgi:hypothetical protein
LPCYTGFTYTGEKVITCKKRECKIVYFVSWSIVEKKNVNLFEQIDQNNFFSINAKYFFWECDFTDKTKLEEATCKCNAEVCEKGKSCYSAAATPISSSAKCYPYLCNYKIINFFILIFNIFR